MIHLIHLKNKIVLTGFCFLFSIATIAQETGTTPVTVQKSEQEHIIDRIIAVVSTNPILQSELETQYQQLLAEQTPTDGNTRCNLIEELLYQKLLLAQAQKDSLEVTEGQIDQEMDRRINYFIQQFGSEEKFTFFYGKTIDDF